jgi:hypothetical protein
MEEFPVSSVDYSVPFGLELSSDILDALVSNKTDEEIEGILLKHGELDNYRSYSGTSMNNIKDYRDRVGAYVVNCNATVLKKLAELKDDITPDTKEFIGFLFDTSYGIHCFYTNSDPIPWNYWSANPIKFYKRGDCFDEKNTDKDVTNAKKTAPTCSHPKCRKTDNLKKCARCSSVRYCGKEHQVASWADHKQLCKVIADDSKDVVIPKVFKFTGSDFAIRVKPTLDANEALKKSNGGVNRPMTKYLDKRWAAMASDMRCGNALRLVHLAQILQIIPAGHYSWRVVSTSVVGFPVCPGWTVFPSPIVMKKLAHILMY